MNLSSYLQTSQNNIYYFRRVVPVHLRDIIGKREIKVSLRTRNPQKAMILARVFYLKSEQLFFRYGDSSMSLLDLIYELGEKGYDSAALDEIVYTMYGTVTADGGEGTSLASMDKRQHRRIVQQVERSHDTQTAQALQAVMDYIEKSKEKDRAELEILVEEKLGLSKTSTTHPTSSTISSPTIAPVFTSAPAHSGKRISKDKDPGRVTISDLVYEYISYRYQQFKNNGKPDWVMPYKERKVYRVLQEILGDKTPISKVDRGAARNFVNVLQELSNNSTRYKGKSVSQILDLMADDEETLKPKSINDYIEIVTGLFNYAIIEKEIVTFSNPFSKTLKLKDTRKKDKRDPFTRPELKDIFAGEWFTRFNHDHHLPHLYWAPLIALFTGCRNNEVASLFAHDIKAATDEEGRPVLDQEGGQIWYFSININGYRKKIKTINAIRNVPLHPSLLKFGLLDYREQVLKKGKDTMLFDYFTYDDYSGYGRLIGENFIEYLKKIGIWVKRKKVFYSFRHTLYNELVNKNIPDERRELLSGRAADGFESTGKSVYGSDNAIEMKSLYEDILKIDFDSALSEVKPFYEMDT